MRGAVETARNPQPGFAARPDDHIVILMGLCDGARWLDAQLASIEQQTRTNWSLIVSDDGSRDSGPDQVVRYSRATDRAGSVQLVGGPRRGFVRNYLSLIASVGPKARLAAFSDQDDVWLSERLSRAATALSAVDPATPALYAATTWITPEDLSARRLSRPAGPTPSFANALVQCVGGGNTMALNRAAIDLLQAAAPEAILATGGLGRASHDWWMYQMITGAGGTVVTDQRPCLLYRQHDRNLSGTNRGPAAILTRARQVMQGAARSLTDRNIAALSASAQRLTPQNRRLLRGFSAARKQTPHKRLLAFRRLGLHRQSRAGTLALLLAGFLGLV